MFKISNPVKSTQGDNMKWIIGAIAAVVALVSDMRLVVLTINITNNYKQAKKKKVPKKEKIRRLQKRKAKRKIASRPKNGK